MTTLICDCNKTMPLDGPALRRVLGPEAGAGLETVHSTLCRREAGAFQRAAKSGEPVLVACTQESKLFLELNEETEGAASVAERPIRFVNIRESGGWSKDAAAALPKMAALIAAAQLPPAEPVPLVSYRSAGRVLVIGAADAALRAARMLADKLEVTVLLTRPGGSVPQERAMAVHAGSLTRLGGWLGAFEASWTSANPIDLDLCTRCNACIDVCPEQAIDFSYQVDLAKCTGHRECVRVCEAAGAIDFQREAQAVTESFDLVLDLGAVPQIALHQPPQGYFHAADDAAPDRRGARAARERRRVREAEVLQLPAEDLRPQPQRADRLHRLHRGLLGRGDPQRRLAQGPHRRRRHRRRAAPVRRLRRLHHGLPERRPELRDAAAGGARPAHPHAPRHPCAGRRQRRGAADPQPGRRRPASSARSAGRRAPTRRCAACRRGCCRSRSGTPPRSASTSGCRRSPSARSRSGC